MQAKHILIVDDEVDLCEILKFNLQVNGYKVEIAHSGEEALEKDLSEFDVFLFDVMMDGINGFELMNHLRINLNIHKPVLFITALTSEENVLKGFDIGAEDYIKKPFSVKEVIARVNAVLNRSNQLHEPNSTATGIKIDEMRKQILLNDKPIDFTKTEFDLFKLLYNQPGKVYSREEILRHVWTNEHYVSGRTVDVNITRIRKKMGKHGICIVTRSGYGYFYDDKKIIELNARLKAV